MAEAKPGIKAQDALSVEMILKGETASETLNSLQGKAEKMQKKIMELGPVLVKTLAVLTVAAVTMYVKISDDIAKLSQQMGAIGDSGATFLEGYQQSFAAFGILAHDAMDSLREFSRVGFKGSAEELQKAAAEMHIFAEMTGLGKSEVAEYTSELSKFGSEATGIASETMASFVHLQKTFKMSAREAQGLFAATQSAALALFSYAKGDVTQGIADSVKEVQKFGAMLSKTGVSAKTTGKLLESLSNPKMWMENSFLMTKMGYSIGDMNKALTTGDLPKAADMYKNLTSVAQDYYKQAGDNVFMQEMYAETLGITVDEFTKLGKQTQEQTDAMVKQLETQQSLTEAWAGFGEGMSKIKRAMGIFTGMIGMALMPVTKVFAKFMNMIGEIAQKFATWAQESKWVKAFMGGFLISLTLIVAALMGWATWMVIAAVATSAFLAPLYAGVAVILGVSALIGALVAQLIAFDKKTGILTDTWKFFLDTVIPPLSGALAIVKDAFKGLGEAFAPLFEKLGQGESDFRWLGETLKFLVKIITGPLIMGIQIFAAVLAGIIDLVAKVVTMFVNWKESIGVLWWSIQQVFPMMLAGFAGLVPTIIEKFKKIGPAIKASILSALATLPMVGKFFKTASVQAQAELTTVSKTEGGDLSGLGATAAQTTAAEGVGATEALNENINNNIVNVDKNAEMTAQMTRMAESSERLNATLSRAMPKTMAMKPAVQFMTPV